MATRTRRITWESLSRLRRLQRVQSAATFGLVVLGPVLALVTDPTYRRETIQTKDGLAAMLARADRPFRNRALECHTPGSIFKAFTAILAIVAFGAAADPGTGREGTANWVNPHMLVALMGTCCIVWAIFVQGTNLHRNAAIIEQVAEEVKKEREARGLPVESST